MTFDQQLQQTLETLADRLRGETERSLAILAGELASAVEAERAAAAALATADAHMAAERGADARVADAVAAAEQMAGVRLANAVAAAQLEAGTRLAAADQEAGERLAAAVAAAELKAGERLAAAVTGAQQEAGGRLAAAVADAQEEAGQRLAAAVAAAEAQGREAGLQAGREEGREEGRQQGREEARQQGREEGREKGSEVADGDLRAAELVANERLVDAIRALDRARSLSEILDTLASCAGREAKRIGILLLRHGQLRGWRFIGFGPELDERSDYELRSGDAGVIAEAARTGLAASADSATPLSTPAFAVLPPGREVLAVPIPMSGQVVAVLYGDQGPADVSGVERRVAWPAALEVMARHAARCLEAITAFRAAQVLTERPDVAHAVSAAAPRAGESAERTAVGTTEDADQAAKRYARLLVSEIKLYHEGAVIAGCRERDLMTRLGGEIARARVLYEQRVPADARRGTDHFHHELVRTLANGDAGLLEARS